MRDYDELDPGQRSPDLLEALNVGTLPEKPWAWSEEDVVFSAEYHGEWVSDAGAGSGGESSRSSSRSSSDGGHATAQTSPSSSLTASGTVSPKRASSALLVRSFHQGWDRAFDLHHCWPRPTVAQPNEVLIRNHCIGLNPVDFKSVVYRFGINALPWILGRDISGTVEQVGEGVTSLHVGDRVWTCADSRDVRCGAYQEYSVADAATVGKVPDQVTDEQAATLGTGLVTAAIALWWFFKLPLPSVAEAAQSGKGKGKQDDGWILIYGGGAITGIFAAQLAALSGVKVLAVASPSNFSYLRDECGVSACIDRFLSPEQIEEQILEVTKGSRISYALDCVGSKTSDLCARAQLESAAAAAGSGGGAVAPSHFIGLGGNPKMEIPADAHLTVHRISFSTTFYGDAAWSTRVLSELERLLGTGALRASRYEVVPDGLAGVRKGLEILKDGRAPQACKLIAQIHCTPPADLTNLGVRCELDWNGV